MKKEIILLVIVIIWGGLCLGQKPQSTVLQKISPKKLGIDSLWMHHQVDSIIKKGIESGAFPGCQILAAQRGQVFFHKAYGFHTYEQQQAVGRSDLYDLASLTKVSAAMPVLIKLYEQGTIKLDTPFTVYWPDFAHNRKRNMTVRQVLAHQAGLKPYFTFYKRHQKRNGQLRRTVAQRDSSANFSIRLTDSLWLHSGYPKKMYKRIKRSRLKPKQGYVYSGLPFLIFPQIIEQQIGQPFEKYLYDSLYHPLGAKSLLFNPYQHLPLSRIVPTERDSFFRYQLLHGVVHDESAAMLEGISGNAGLFGNSMDLAKLLQLLLNGGSYGDFEFLEDSSIQAFTAQQYESNRRGLGFDKPLLEMPERGYAAPQATRSSYGHSGYTGTMWWIDPEKELIFIFLSNRVHPTRERKGIYQLNIRPSVHQIMYKVLDGN